ncbi:hypothetical protein BH10BAC3_BH10BAC3_20470 [soil metagenome]
MFGNKKGLLLAGLAAYAYYKYNKMTPAEKEKLVGGIKEKGQKLYDDYVPAEIKNMIGKKRQPEPDTTSSAGSTDFVL